MKRIKLYRLPLAGWWLSPCEGSQAVAAEIDLKHKVAFGVRDRRVLVFKADKNWGGITVEEAIARGIVRLVQPKG